MDPTLARYLVEVHTLMPWRMVARLGFDDEAYALLMAGSLADAYGPGHTVSVSTWGTRCGGALPSDQDFAALERVLDLLGGSECEHCLVRVETLTPHACHPQVEAMTAARTRRADVLWH